MTHTNPALDENLETVSLMLVGCTPPPCFSLRKFGHTETEKLLQIFLLVDHLSLSFNGKEGL